MSTTPPRIKISAYKAWINKQNEAKPGAKPYDTDFYTEMEAIRDGKHKDLIDQCKSIEDKKLRDAFKCANLPSLTISAVCKEWRKLDNVVNHTGLLNIDIDPTDNPHIKDWGALRDQIFTFPNVVTAFLSASWRGVAFVVKILPEEHKDVFFSIVDGLKSQLNIIADAGVNDITRLRFVSYDPDCRIRYDFDSIPLARPSSDYLENKKHFGSSSVTLEPIGDVDSDYNFYEAVKKASAGGEFKDGHKWAFLISLAGSCNVMGMSLQFIEDMVCKTYLDKSGIDRDRLLKPVRDVYQLYTEQHATYNVQATFDRLNYKVKQFIIQNYLHEGVKPSDQDIVDIGKETDADPIRVQRVIERVWAEYGDEFDYNNFPQIKKVEIWLRKRWRFDFNCVTGQTEYSPVHQSRPDTVNPDEVYRQLQLTGFKFSLNNVKSLLKSSFVKSYDPIRDYFNELPFDDNRDYIAELGEYIKTTNQPFWIDQFKKTLVRSIPCGFGLQENRIVTVFYQKAQETGKTSFIRFLSPWGKEKYFTEAPIVGGNMKDTEIRLSENFMYNLEELAGLSRIDVNKLKADISKASIKERRPHGYFETYAPRRCNFWGSTNTKEFLYDDYNSRWNVFEILTINWGYRDNIDIRKVWAQAYQLFKDGFNYQLSQMDRAERDRVNEDYRYRRPEEELLARHFKPSKKGLGQFYTATEIANHLSNLGHNNKVNPNNIGKTMVAVFGLESIHAKIDGRSVRGYWLTSGFNLADEESPKLGGPIPF
jgi:hypothetical protein